MTNKKVIFVNRFFYPDHSATSQMLSDLAFDLAKEGKTVEIVTSRLRYDDPSAHLAAFEVIGGVSVHRVWTSRFGRGNLAGRAIDYLTFYLTAGWKLWRRTDSDTVIVAKTDPPLISVVAAPIAKLREARLVNWLQDLFPEVAAALGVKFMRGTLLGLLKRARNLTLHAAYMNVALGRRMEALVHSQGVPMAQICTISNWADDVANNPVPKDENSLCRAWGLQGKFVVGYSGNLGRAHDFDTIMDAANILKDRTDIVFLFIGGGAQQHAVEHEVSRHNLESVQFKSYQPRERLSESLSVADVHLISLKPALEGLIVPSKIYGIAAVARAVIFVGDPAGEIARILHNQNCGYSVDVRQGILLSEVIVKLADEPGLCKKLGANSRRFVDRQNSRAKAVDKWVALLELC